MFNVGIDLRILDNKYLSGVGRYAKNLVTELIKYDQENYSLISGIDHHFLSKSNYIDVSLPQSNLLLANKLETLLGYVNDLDLIFSPYYPVTERRSFKAVLTIHDLIPLRSPELFNNEMVFRFFDQDIRRTVNHVEHIIADSYSTKKDIMECYAVDESKISVVHLASDPVFSGYEDRNSLDEKSILNKYKINKPYLLSVCTIEPRKNLSRTLKAYKLLRERGSTDLCLVLVGALGWNYRELLKEITESKLADDIIITGYIPDEDLPVIYKCAQIFTYNSLYEGFGLPILEAMSCGVPVVTSNVSSIPEVAGDSVVYCNPYEVESIAEAMEKALTDESLQRRLSMLGKERAQLFSWEKTAAQTRDVFGKVLSE